MFSCEPVTDTGHPITQRATPRHSFAVADGTVEVFQSWREVEPAVWRTLFAGGSKDYRYYEIAEDALRGQFEQRYFVLRPAQGAPVVQPFFIVEQDLTAGVQGGWHKLINRLRGRWPRFLKPRMLMVGCTAGEGQLNSTEPWAVRMLHDAVRETARREKISFLLFKDFLAEFRSPLRGLTERGFARVPSMPGAGMAIEDGDFETFMQQRLGKVFRKNLRRKFKASAAVGALEMEVTSDVTPIVAELQALYLQTHERSQLKFERLNPEYFCGLSRRMPERARFFLWRLQGRLVAFSLCLVHDGTLYDLNVGMDYAVALDLHLYFVTFRDIYNWAAANGLKRYSTGPLNYDPKLHLQLALEPLDLYARHTNPLFNAVFKRALKYLEPARHDPAIRQFRNFKELY